MFSKISVITVERHRQHDLHSHDSSPTEVQQLYKLGTVTVRPY